MKVALLISLFFLICINAGCSTTTWGMKGGIVEGRVDQVVGASLTDDDKFIVKYKVVYYDGYGDKLDREPADKYVSFNLKDFSYDEKHDKIDKNEYTNNNYRQYKLYIDNHSLGNPIIVIDHDQLKTKDGRSNLYHAVPDIVIGKVGTPKTREVLVKSNAILNLNDQSCIDEKDPLFYYRITNIQNWDDSHTALFYRTKEYCRAYMIPVVEFRDENFTDYMKRGAVMTSAVIVDIISAPFQVAGLVLLGLAGGVGGPGR